jgi:hypothetical protein
MVVALALAGCATDLPPGWEHARRLDDLDPAPCQDWNEPNDPMLVGSIARESLGAE